MDSKQHGNLASQIKELFRYGIAGVIATLINIFVYLLLADVLGVDYLVSNAVAWICAFLFAFVSNKNWVFGKTDADKDESRREFAGFLGVRLFTLVLDMLMMWLFVGVFAWSGALSKIVDNVVVIAINYVASKFFIFK